MDMSETYDPFTYDPFKLLNDKDQEEKESEVWALRILKELYEEDKIDIIPSIFKDMMDEFKSVCKKEESMEIHEIDFYKDSFGMYDGSKVKCPRCQKVFPVIRDYDYCPDCGQKLSYLYVIEKMCKNHIWGKINFRTQDDQDNDV